MTPRTLSVTAKFESKIPSKLAVSSQTKKFLFTFDESKPQYYKGQDFLILFALPEFKCLFLLIFIIPDLHHSFDQISQAKLRMESSVNQRKKNLSVATCSVSETEGNQPNPQTQAVNLLTLFNVLFRKINPLPSGKTRWWYRLFGKQTIQDEIDEAELADTITPEILEKIWTVIHEASPSKEEQKCAVGDFNSSSDIQHRFYDYGR
ncbi:unnamed protein product [Ambrosiozyma monospora]|uniref:Unnamed protein product n=1 Tax=Ambrosiozyma monospora TaxID=43982 RepID=A0ACB5TMF9_AMBMO|nr:unnamed protein product [Ambrosiozyma monospora]